VNGRRKLRALKLLESCGGDPKKMKPPTGKGKENAASINTEKAFQREKALTIMAAKEERNAIMTYKSLLEESGMTDTEEYRQTCQLLLAKLRAQVFPPTPLMTAPRTTENAAERVASPLFESLLSPLDDSTAAGDDEDDDTTP